METRVRDRQTPKTSSPPRPLLHRSSDDRLVAGVCGGIARFLGIDPLWPRLVFVVLALAWGSGVALYILVWWMIPADRPPSGAAPQLARLRPLAFMIGCAVAAAGSAWLMYRFAPDPDWLAWPILAVLLIVPHLRWRPARRHPDPVHERR